MRRRPTLTPTPVPASRVRVGDVLVLNGIPAAKPVDYIDDRGPALVIGHGNHVLIRAARVTVTVLRPAPVGRQAVLAKLGAAVLEHEQAWAAALRPTGDPDERAAADRRLAEAQLALADRYSETSVLYRAGSATHTAMVNAASYIRAAALTSPALIGGGAR